MKISCISDLHAGTCDRHDRLRINEDRLMSFLETLCVHSDLVLLNGDVFDTIQGEDWDSCASRFMEIRKARPWLVDFIIDKILLGNIRYIAGNSDWVVRERNLLPLVERTATIEYEGIKIVAEHGHFPDMFGYKPFTVDKLIAKWAYYAEKLLRNDVDVKLAKFLQSFPAGSSSKEGHHNKYACDLAKKKKADVVLLGHTHKVTAEKYDNCLYVNTGKACDRAKQIDITTVIIEKGSYSVAQKRVTV